jgi:hypothetical protein
MILVAIGLCSITAGIVLTMVHGAGFGSLPPLLAGSVLTWTGIQRALRPTGNKRANLASTAQRWLMKLPKEAALLAGMSILSTGLVLTLSHGFSLNLLPLLGSGTAFTVTACRRFLHSPAPPVTTKAGR